MSNHDESFYKDIPIEKFDGNIEDLGFMSEEEAVEYTLNIFMEGVQKINREILGYEIDIDIDIKQDRR